MPETKGVKRIVEYRRRSAPRICRESRLTPAVETNSDFPFLHYSDGWDFEGAAFLLISDHIQIVDSMERRERDRMYSEMASFKLLDICEEIESYEEQLQAAYSFICYYKLQEQFKEFCEHEALIDAEIPLDRELIVNGHYSA